MSLDNLPVEWLSLQLKDIGNIYTGKTPSSKDAANFEGDIPFVKPGDLAIGGYIFQTSTHISSQALATLPNLPVNSIMVTCIGNMGKVGITTKVSATNQQINSIVPFKEFINYKYIYYYCLTLKNWLDRESSATTIAIVNKGRFSEAPIPLPPIAEQQEIVRQLDVMLAQVEHIKARLDAIPAILKKFRQSVLADAVSGKIGKDNLELAEDGYPLDWDRLSFSDLGSLSRGKSKHRPRNDARLFGSEYPFIQTGEVANSNGLISEADKFYSEFGLQQSKLFPKGTLCITIAANIADTAILGIDACFPDSVVGFIADTDRCNTQFIKYFIDVNKQNLEKFAPATAQKNINLKILNALELPIPDLNDQKIIVKQVEQYLGLIKNIENIVTLAQKRVNLLTQSILAKAFSGELTAEWREQHQELITGVNSAESLLAKIQAEREASKPVKKTRAKKEV